MRKKATYTVRKRRTRYINSQRHKASCGPIAIANVIKWLGIETSYRSVLQFCEGILAYRHGHGMAPFQMVYALKTMRIRFKRKTDFGPEFLEEVLNGNGSMILVYDTVKYGTHAVFVDASNETHYRVWNRMKGLKTPWVEKKYIQDAIERSRGKKGNLYAFVFARPEVSITIKS